MFDAHDRAFSFFKGACSRGIYDNMKTAVDAVFLGKERQFNRRFMRMCAHYLVEPTACTPAAGWEKGQVENQVGLIRERFFTPRLRVKSYEELNAWLLDKCVAYRQGAQASRTAGQDDLGGLRGGAVEACSRSWPLRRLSCDAGLGLEDLPRALRHEQILRSLPRRRPALSRSTPMPTGLRSGRMALSSQSIAGFLDAARRSTTLGIKCRSWPESPAR